MPVRIGTLGAGGLGVHDHNGLRMVTPSAASANRWLESAGYSFPNEDLLRRFLEQDNGRYGFLDYGLFFHNLCTMIYSGPIQYYDLYAGTPDRHCNPVRTAALQFLLENLRLGVALQIAPKVATPQDLFALSAIWGAEVALTLNGGNLYVYSQGRAGAVRVPLGHSVLAHTHPTDSIERTQVDLDIEVAGIGRAEIVITADMIIYFTRNTIINPVRRQRIEPLAGLCIGRDTPLTPVLFDTLYAEYVEIMQGWQAAEALEEQQQRANLAAAGDGGGDDSWMAFLS